MKKMIVGFAVFIVVMLMFTMTALAAGDTFYIDTETVYPGMEMSYSQGYVPSVSNGSARFVLPLKTNDTNITGITVTPLIGTDEDSPFSYGNYEFNVQPDTTGVFLIDLTLPLKANRINGTYPVTFKVKYTDGTGNTGVQEFSVFIAITDGIDPNAPEASPEPVIAGKLYIDSNSLYPGMTSTYAQGYMPLVQHGYAYIVLPLLGNTYDGRVTVTADLGATADSPFVYGNYSQTATGFGKYLFAMEIPLAKGRFNGSYPVTLKAGYLDTTGAKAEQSFTVYVTITDGKNPPDPNAKQAVEKPELFISECTVEPNTVGGEEQFTVKLTIDNIGAIRARSVRLSYGSEAAGIIPVGNNSATHLENIASEESAEASFMLQTTKDVLAGNQPFYVTLDYVDLYGGIYTSTRTFLVQVTQPAEMGYDSVSMPKSVTAGETVSLPANVFNIGKSTLRNVTVTLEGAGLFPTSSVFLGDILPGEAGYGEMKVFIGMLSMTEGYTESYGNTTGRYIITYTDDFGETHTVEQQVSTEIKQPVIEGEKTEAEKKAEEEAKRTAGQWWISVLVAFAIIAIIITVIIVSKFTRMMRMK